MAKHRHPETLREYRAAGRYGYGAVDVYNGNGDMLRCEIAGVTQKLAYSLASYLNQAFADGVKHGKPHRRNHD